MHEAIGFTLILSMVCVWLAIAIYHDLKVK